jgi:hypothetical protein
MCLRFHDLGFSSLKDTVQRMILLKVGSFGRSSLKSEAQRFSEKLVRHPSSESPLKLYEVRGVAESLKGSHRLGSGHN